MNNLLLSNIVTTLNGFLGPVWYLIILNGFGVLAIVCKICEYQVKKRTTMLMIATMANFLWVLYFIFYGDFASALTCLIGCIRLLIFMQKGKYKWADSPLWLIFFLALQVAVAIFTFRIWQDLISITAGFFGIFAYFVIDPKKYRALSFIHMALWVVNSAVKFYPIALISDSVSTISVTVAMIRFSIMEKKAKKNNTQPKETETATNNQ